MKAVVISKEFNSDYDNNEIVNVVLEYLVGDGPDSETVEILVTSEEAVNYPLGEEVDLL